MSQMICRRPLSELELSHKFRFDPDAVLHIFRGQSLTPHTFFLFGKICEGTFFNSETF